MKNPISQIDQKITQLKQKKEKLLTQQAVLFFKEAQKLIGEDKFSPELALSILNHSWKESSDKQKEEWKNSSPSFRESKQNNRKEAPKGAKATA